MKGRKTKKEMGIITEMNKEENAIVFPEGKIILLDGRIIDCYPVANDEEVNVVDDGVKLDTTGEYLSVKKKPKGVNLSKPKQVEPNSIDIQKEMFIKNAFYLLAHKERILSDSRMFLCPIHIQNGLAYTGTSGFRKPTLGVYIEWWLNCVGTMRTDEEGRKSLVFHLAGSPLSGMNHCAAVDENGKKESVVLSPFINYWPRFMDINKRYTDAKYKYQAYELKEVLDILEQEDSGSTDYVHIIDIEFMKHTIISLNRKVDSLTKERDGWHTKYIEAQMKYNDTKIRELYAEYLEVESKINAEIDGLREQKKTLKADLKSGRINNITYQHHLTPIKQHIQDLEMHLANFRCSSVKGLFPDGDIDFTMIEQYMKKIEQNQENPTLYFCNELLQNSK